MRWWLISKPHANQILKFCTKIWDGIVLASPNLITKKVNWDWNRRHKKKTKKNQRFRNRNQTTQTNQIQDFDWMYLWSLWNFIAKKKKRYAREQSISLIFFSLIVFRSIDSYFKNNEMNHDSMADQEMRSEMPMF